MSYLWNGGLSFLVTSGSPSRTALFLKTQSRMLCPISSPLTPPFQKPIPFCLPPALWELLPCDWRRESLVAPLIASLFLTLSRQRSHSGGIPQSSPATLASSFSSVSLVTVDFVTSHPLSDGSTSILTVVDRFSKAVHFIPLTKLLSD